MADERLDSPVSARPLIVAVRYILSGLNMSASDLGEHLASPFADPQLVLS